MTFVLEWCITSTSFTCTLTPLILSLKSSSDAYYDEMTSHQLIRNSSITCASEKWNAHSANYLTMFFSSQQFVTLVASCVKWCRKSHVGCDVMYYRGIKKHMYFIPFFYFIRIRHASKTIPQAQ